MKKIIVFIVCTVGITPAIYCAADVSVVKTAPTEPTEAFLYLQLKGLERSFAYHAPRVYKAPDNKYNTTARTLQESFVCFHTLGFKVPATRDVKADFRAIFQARVPAVMDLAYQIFSRAGKMDHSRNEILKNPALVKVLASAFMAHRDRLKKIFFERHLVLKASENIDFAYIAHSTREAQAAVLTTLQKARTEWISEISLTAKNEKFDKEWLEFEAPLRDEDCMSIIREELAKLN